MCGIVASFSQTSSLDSESLRRAIGALRHRGPDAERYWCDAARQVGLGHARLSIIDLQTGDQPIANEDESLHVVVNGGFYDFERTRRELESRGHRFRTASDSEIVLHLYEEEGVHCVNHLRGEFAFVLWDARNQLLFAARDRFGIKPLVYAMHGKTLVLASEVKALFEAGVTAQWDAESVFQNMNLGGPIGDRTLFAGVRQVPPGHYLIATARHHRLVRYWDFDYPTVGSLRNDRSDAEHAAEFSFVLEEAIRLRLRADVPVGCYLSGGLDSCAVLGFAARYASTPVRAFTLAFDRPDYDEAPIAREMAGRANAEFYPVPVSSTDLADNFADAIWHTEQLLNNANGVAKFRLSRAARDAGYKVVLTGEGADEILAGYPHFRSDMLLHNTEGQDPATVETLLAELQGRNVISRGILMPDGEGLSLATVRNMLGGFVPTWLQTFATVGLKIRGLLAENFISPFAERDAYALFLDTLEVSRQLQRRDPVHQAQYLWSKSVLPMYILTALGDRMEMAHSIEGRVPFLDHRVVEAACALPVNQKIRGMIEKHVLREAARLVITETVYRRQKHPFFAPPAASAPDSRLHELMQTTLRGAALRAVPFYDPRKVVGLLDRLPQMDDASRTAIDAVLMTVLSACLLQERFKLGEPL